MKIKLTQNGDAPLSGSGPKGDLYVRVLVKPSQTFRRQGTNLYHDAKVPLHTAMLGGRMRVPTLEGDVDVRVREGIQHGDEAVLKGRGVKSVYGKERGDLIVQWRIQIPRSLSPLQRKLMQAFAADAEGRSPYVSFDPPKDGPSPTPSKPTPEVKPSSEPVTEKESG
jgi:molecular chaperone DnaJ